MFYLDPDRIEKPLCGLCMFWQAIHKLPNDAYATVLCPEVRMYQPTH